MTKEKLVFIGLRRKEPLLELDRDKIDKVQPGILGPFRKFEDSGPEKELIQIISGEHLYCINGRLLDSWLNLLGKK